MKMCIHDVVRHIILYCINVRWTRKRRQEMMDNSHQQSRQTATSELKKVPNLQLASPLGSSSEAVLIADTHSALGGCVIYDDMKPSSYGLTLMV